MAPRVSPSRPLSRPVVADAVVPVDMPAFQPVGPDDVRVHGRQRRSYVAGIETVIQPLEKFSVAGHIKSGKLTRERVDVARRWPS